MAHPKGFLPKDINALDLLVWKKFVNPVKKTIPDVNTIWYSKIWHLLVDDTPGKINGDA